MKTIFKYQLIGTGAIHIELPKKHKILSAVVQNGKPMLYALVDDESPTIRKRVFVLLTGFPAIEVDNVPFIATLVLSDGSYILHVFANLT